MSDTKSKSKSKSKTKTKSKVGRPSNYETRVKPHLDWVKKCVDEGHTEKSMVKALGVGYSQWFEYKHKYPEFKKALEKSTDIVEMNKEQLLHQTSHWILNYINNEKIPPKERLDALKYFESTRLGMISEKDKRYFKLQREKLKLMADLSDNAKDDNVDNKELKSFIDALGKV